jgi:hypothetical protein
VLNIFNWYNILKSVQQNLLSPVWGHTALATTDKVIPGRARARPWLLVRCNLLGHGSLFVAGGGTTRWSGETAIQNPNKNRGNYVSTPVIKSNYIFILHFSTL